MARHCFRSGDDYETLRERARAADEPVTIEALVKIWAKNNRDEIIEVALRMMREPPRTQFTIPPLTFSAFPSGDEREHYLATLIEELKREQPTRRVRMEQLLSRHVAKTILWVRRELEEQLAGILKESKVYHDKSDATPDKTAVSAKG
jgi:hypothetical protein